MRSGTQTLLPILLILLTPGLAAAERGFTMSQGTLYTLDLETGDLELFVHTTLDLHAFSLALAPDGRLLALTSPSEDLWQMHEIDLSGATSVFGGFAREGSRDVGLEFAPDGRLWASSGNQLHHIDSMSGAILDTLILERNIVALAARSDGLYALTFDPYLGHWIERVSLEDEALKKVAVLDFFESIEDASFDSFGRLRLSARAGSLLAYVARVFYQVEDPEVGEWEITAMKAFHFTDPLAGIGALAVLPAAASSAVEVPTLDELGLTILGALLAGLALVVLRRGR